MFNQRYVGNLHSQTPGFSPGIRISDFWAWSRTCCGLEPASSWHILLWTLLWAKRGTQHNDEFVVEHPSLLILGVSEK